MVRSAAMDACSQCARGPAVHGVLCRRCAEKLSGCAGLLPEHVDSRAEAAAADGWLIDPFGRPHPLDGVGSVVGRQAEHRVIVLHETVSRAHARLTRSKTGWEVRDLGSKNQTRVENRRVNGKTPVPDGALIQFGKVPFFLRCEVAAAPALRRASVSTVDAGHTDLFSCVLRGEQGQELQLLDRSPDRDSTSAAPGVLLYRGDQTAEWVEISLAPVEVSLLRLLCSQSLSAASQPSQLHRCVTTDELARRIPFRSPYANEDNVRQAIRRLRRTLRTVGIEGLVEAIPGHGYYVTWQTP